ncbi:hypothetical protein NESM_000768400 [Novymonas esmeraldas]|uniref:Stealth protein CR2 conserved region 2 domain-containing protein n=1 Tax=Novymonas esmeraldas TaxID=1808958 RepID=A0AAW0EWD7_9TRYP
MAPRSPRHTWPGKPRAAAPETPRRSQWTVLRRPCLACALVFVCFAVLFAIHSQYCYNQSLSEELNSVSEERCTLHTSPGTTHSGFSETPVESTVLMLYSPGGGGGGRFCYSDATGEAGTVEQEFLRVAASYVSSPHAGPTGAYHDFFAAHDATLWTLDGATRVATPMRLDVVYTFVNPNAASFQRNMEARRVPFEQRRYRDWEELRYSLRSLREFVLANAALAQYHRRHAADVRRLGELGYTVGAEAGDVDGVVSLVRRVYLVLSNKDQVPAWLDVEKFPELRVVTHAEMFSEAEAAWVLPTLNSNAIESGLHRIPGISRFFFYTSNDMLFGRRLSFFDLFRPLSPLRQRLHIFNLSRTADGVSAASATSNEMERVALLLEPVMHSDTQKLNPKKGLTDGERKEASRARDEVSKCLFRDVRAAFKSRGGGGSKGVEPSTVPSWATTRAFALHNPRGTSMRRGEGVAGEYYYQLSSLRLNGIKFPFGYAHIPQLVDREVYRRMNEVEFFDLTNSTRAAYEREMYPYAPIDQYAIFAVAMMRGVERHLWGSMSNGTNIVAFEDVRESQAAWWGEYVAGNPTHAMHRVAKRLSAGADISAFGTLYGDTWSVQLQRPDLDVELEYWWVRGAVQPTQPSRRIEVLKGLYAIPEVSTGATCSSGSPEWTPRSNDHYFSLLHDMFHHTRRDGTFLFEMIENDMKALLLAARLRYEWVQRPLFMGFNDNFPDSANFTVSKHIFNTLLGIVSHDCAPAPWERA